MLSLLVCFFFFDFIMGVFLGICDDLICIDLYDDGCFFGIFVFLVILMQIGEIYYIYIIGMGIDSGDFGLLVNCEFLIEVNDLCEDVLVIVCGVILIGSIFFVSNDDVLFDCGIDLDVVFGVWYIFQGDGLEVIVLICGSFIGFDIKFGVFSGSCFNLVCVIGDDDDLFCVLVSLFIIVIFNFVFGEIYYIYVMGFL